MLWAVHFMDAVASQVLQRGADERLELAKLLAFEWPREMFQRLVRAVVDVLARR